MIAGHRTPLWAFCVTVRSTVLTLGLALVCWSCSWRAALCFGNHALLVSKPISAGTGTLFGRNKGTATARAAERFVDQVAVRGAYSRDLTDGGGRGLSMAIIKGNWPPVRRTARGLLTQAVARAAAETESGDESSVLEAQVEANGKLVLERPIDRVVLPPGRGLRVHCLSDLHTDYKANMAWLKTWPSWKGSDEGQLGEGHEDVLLVAGDVSSSIERTSETLTDLKERYDQVFFVVGNHDLWTARRKQNAAGTDEEEDGGSVQKLMQVHQTCESLGVRTNPAVFEIEGGVIREGDEGLKQGQTREVGVFPLLSWYHASWDQEPDLPAEDQFRNGNFFRRWGDYVYCRWPADLCSREDFVTVDRDAPPVLAEFFAQQNDACIKTFVGRRNEGSGDDDGATRRSNELEATQEGGGGGGGKKISDSGGTSVGNSRASTVISFSHFLPRQELCPEKRFLAEPNLTKVIGSAPLERQVRELGSDLHVFGHTHIPIDMDCDDIRYVQWPLGSVLEQSRQCKKMREQGPLLIYSHDGNEGGVSQPVSTFWGDHYRAHQRDVRETYVPEWALKRIRGRRKAKVPPPGLDPLASE